MKLNVMLLAAGKGERLRPFTETTPKPLIPFLGRPMVEYSLYQLESFARATGATIENLVVNTHHLPEQIENYFRNVRPSLAKSVWKNLHISYEPNLLAGGGIKKCENILRSTREFLVINADEVYFPSEPRVLQYLLERRQNRDELATLLCMRHPGVGTRFGGVWTNANGRVRGFGKVAPPKVVSCGEPTIPLHFVGFLALSAKSLDFFKTPVCEQNLFYDVLTIAIADGQRVGAIEYPAIWYETGKTEDFLEATQELIEAPNEELQKFLAKTKMFQQEPIIEKASSDLANKLGNFLWRN